MKVLENQCDRKTIIQARQNSIDKIEEMVHENQNIVDQDQEMKIKRSISKKTGWFTSSQTKKQIEENVRKKNQV